jgi:5-methylcytosine-specific restriction endonuclease McrBC regulatory subunit McrC
MTQGQYTTAQRKFKHLTREKRAQIEILLRQGLPKVQIARAVGISRSTLYNELKRGTVDQMDTHLKKYKVFILDTKYKQVSRFEGDTEAVRKVVSEEPKQTDIYQVCEYARKRNVSDVYLLYPMYRYEDAEPYYPVGKSQDANGEIDIHFIRLPFVFEENEEALKRQLKEVIIDIIGL